MEVRGETIGAKIAGRDDMSTASYVSQLIIAVFGIRSYRVTYDGDKLSGTLAIIYDWKETAICRELRRSESA